MPVFLPAHNYAHAVLMQAARKGMSSAFHASRLLCWVERMPCFDASCAGDALCVFLQVVQAGSSHAFQDLNQASQGMTY